MAELSQRAISTGHAGPTISRLLKILNPSSDAKIWWKHVKNAFGCDDRHKTKRTSSDDRHFGARNDDLSLNQENWGDHPQPTGDGTMSWRKSTIFAVDCAAVLAGVLIAAPFVLILTSPFLVSY